jgi:serine/threonine protein kinase
MSFDDLRKAYNDLPVKEIMYHATGFVRNLGVGKKDLEERNFVQDNQSMHVIVKWFDDKKRYASYVRECTAYTKIMEQSEKPESQCCIPLLGKMKRKVGHTDYGIVLPQYEGDLTKIKLKEKDDKEKLVIMLKLAKGIKYLHKIGVIHSDVKPSNVLINGQGDELVWTDFDCSRALTNAAQVTEKTERFPGCTKEYAPPQFFESYKKGDGTPIIWEISKTDDIYSLGIVFFEMMSGIPATEKAAERRASGSQDDDLKADFTIPSLNTLIASMLDLVNKKRPKADQIFDRLRNIALEDCKMTDEEIHSKINGQSVSGNTLSSQERPGERESMHCQPPTFRRHTLGSTSQTSAPPTSHHPSHHSTTTSSSSSSDDSVPPQQLSTHSVNSNTSTPTQIYSAQDETPDVSTDQENIVVTTIPKRRQPPSHCFTSSNGSVESTVNGARKPVEAITEEDLSPIRHFDPGMFKEGSMCIIRHSYIPTVESIYDKWIIARKGDFVVVWSIQSDKVWVENLFSHARGYIPRPNIDQKRCCNSLQTMSPELFKMHWLDRTCRVALSQMPGTNSEGLSLVQCSVDNVVLIQEADQQRKGWVKVLNTSTGQSGYIHLRNLERLPKI